MIRKYRKLWVALTGVILIAGKELFGIEFGATPDAIYNGVVAVLVAAGVVAAPNSPS